jgi:hypothetical protein
MNELPNTAMSALRLMPSRAGEVARFSMQIVKSVQNGEANALEVLVMLRSLEAVSELVREEIEANILTEAERNPEKKFEAFGAIVEKSELGTKYNYLKTGDVEYERLKKESDSAKEKLTERETFLKSLREPLTVVSEETGEVYSIRPPLKTSKSGVKVFLK